MHKTIKWAMAIALALASPALYALGLGSAKVNSYLNQPLDVRVELISQSSEELQSITTGLASARDFELLGLKLNAISVPLEFEIVAEGNKPYIHITSRLSVGDPVMQVLLEVVWANGRMLREYTLFLDPPTLASKAPAPVVSTKPVFAAAAPVVEPTQAATPAGSSSSNTISPPEQLTSAPATEQAADVYVSDDEPESSPQTQRQEASSATVAKGQTLWGIASDWSKGTGYSVNQTMLAIQRKNPSAFIDNNINRLKQGEILRMPSSNEMADVSSQQAALEVLRQSDEIGAALGMPDYDTPTVADSSSYQESSVEDEIFADDEDKQGYLELVPPSDNTDDAVGAISQASDEVTSEDVSEQVLQEKLSRTEEDLVNAELENNYLKERISELEVQAEQATSVQLQDADLANMENTLADKRASDEVEAPIALTPGGEDQPWYAGATIWILAVILFLIVLIIWFLRRRSLLKSAGQQEIENQATVQAVAEEAEDLLDILDNYGASASTRPSKSSAGDEAVELDSDLEVDSKADATSEPKTETRVMPVLVPTPVIEEAETKPEEQPAQVPVAPLEQHPDTASKSGGINAGIQITDEFESGTGSDDGSSQEDDDGESSDPELKLDLARAYLSLGDKEAAKSMLDEVLNNGNDDQKAEARQMLGEL